MKNDQVLVNLKPVKSFDVKLKANDMLTSRLAHAFASSEI